MVFGPLIGAGLGAAAGVGIGSFVFSGDRPKDYNFITEAADRDDNIRTPAAANVSDEMRSIIPLTPEWTFWPDYERWVMINRLLRLIWPKLTTAILKEVISIVKPILQQQLNAIPFVLGVVEDITLGPYSLMDAEHLDPHIADKYFTLGEHPVRVAGMKVYHTTEDTCILETPVLWGSNMVFDIQVYLKIGPVRVVIPISVSHVQFKVISRIVLGMVDTIPCIGGATVSLLDVPYVDYRLSVFNGPDMMALPGIREAVKFVIGYVVKELALYPNSVSVPLMTNFGIPQDPQGMIHISLSKIENLKSTDLLSKGDPYVVFEVREGRKQRSKTVSNNNNPVYNEEFFMVVDDFKHQWLDIKVYDYDMLSPQDDLLGTAQVFFTHESIETDPDTGGQKVMFELADWIRSPMMEKNLVIPLHIGSGGMLKQLTKKASGATKLVKQTSMKVTNMLLGDFAVAKEAEKTTILVAKPVKEVRAQQEREQQAKEVAEAQKVAAEKGVQAEHENRRLQAYGGSAAAAEKLEAHLMRNDWTDEDEKALWAEWKRIGDAKKAVAAAEAKRRKALTKEQRAAEDAQKKAEEAAKLAEDESLTLVDEQVVLRGNGKPLSGKSAGNMFLTLRFMPFDKPAFDDDIELKPLKTGLPALVPFDPPPAREILTNVNDFQKGLLTVKLFKAAGLGKPGSLVSPDPFVEMTLVDCDLRRPREMQQSSVKYNDSTPRWLETFDFVMVSAGSILTIDVKDKTGLVDAALSLKLSKSRFDDKLLGKVQILVSDIARNGHLRDTWALQEAESGTIEMKLEWRNVYVDQYLD